MVAVGFVNDDGKPDRTPYALRHTFATWALRAGLPRFDVARVMGDMVQMIEKHYLRPPCTPRRRVRALGD
jgi:integrase